MEREKQLPYKEPPFYTYQYYASPGVVAMQNPTAYNHYLSHSILLTCGRRFLSGYTSPDLYVHHLTLGDLPFVDHIDVKRSFIDGCELNVIRNMINEGYYVCFNMVDIFYIDNILWSGEKHHLHDGMICGYDDNDHTFTIAAYDNRWVYRNFKASQESFANALMHGKEQGGYDDFIGLKPKADLIKLDTEAMIRHLEEYLTLDPYGKSFDGPDPVCGIIIHDYLRLYLQYLLDKEISYDRKDRRIMRLILEHKKCMADRIAAVEEKLSSSSDFSIRYAPVVESANRAHTYYVAYRMKQKDELLRLIQKELATMKAIEEDVLPDFLKLLKEVPHAVELPET